MTGWQIVQTDAGFHIRYLARNHKTIVSSEVYTRRAAAVHAVELMAGENEIWTWVDERQLVKVERPELPTAARAGTPDTAPAQSRPLAREGDRAARHEED